MLGRDLEPARDVMRDQLVDVAFMARFRLRRGAVLVQKQVVAQPAGDERVFDSLGFAHRGIPL